MKKVIIILLFLTPLCGAAQEDEYEKELDELYKDSIGKMIFLPQLKTWDLYRFPGTIPGEKIVTNEGQYYKIFSAIQKDSLPKIDFSIYNLVPRSACVYCVDICRKYGNYPGPCHRQACSYALRWFLVGKI